MNPRSRFFIFLGVLVLVALAYYYFSTDHSTDLVLIGTVDANQVIVNSKIAGRIEKLTVDEGQDVKEGELIATLDTAELSAAKESYEAQAKSLRAQLGASQASAESTTGDTESAVANAQANLAAAKSALVEASANRARQESDTKRTTALAEQGVMSAQDRDRAVESLNAAVAHEKSARDQVVAAEAVLRAAQARTNQGRAALSNVSATRQQWEAAQAQIAQAEARLGYTRILAPVSGKVNVWAAREGEVVNPGSPIVTIVDLTQTWVYAGIPETQADGVQVGDVLTVRMASGAKVNGKVIAKAAEGDFATQRDVSRRKRDIKTVRLKLLIDNPGEKYVPGMTAEVLVPKSKLVSK